jgi:lipopolysaccharide/colanic/teichoic acid biosynthesis glycosyltransferase
MSTKLSDQQLLSSKIDPVQLQSACQSKVSYLRLKRCIDVAICILAGPAVLIVVMVAVLAIALVIGRPVLCQQPRVELNGRG